MAVLHIHLLFSSRHSNPLPTGSRYVHSRQVAEQLRQLNNRGNPELVWLDGMEISFNLHSSSDQQSHL